MKKSLKIGWPLMLLAGLTACNKNNEIETEIDPDPPVIIFDNDTGIYPLKAGTAITFEPTIENEVEGSTSYSWKLNDKPLVDQHAKSYRFVAETEGQYFIRLAVSTPYGTAEEEVRVDVSALAPPVISFGISGGGMNLLPGTDYTFTPAIVNGERASYEWRLDGIVVEQGTIEEEITYTFNQTETKTYELSLRVTNEDGEDQQTLRLTVMDELPVTVVFPRPMFTRESTDVFAFTGRPVYLTPVLEGGSNSMTFRWSVNGSTVDETGKTLVFTPDTAGEYEVSVVVSSGIAASSVQIAPRVTRSGSTQGTAAVKVIAAGEESSKFRPATGGSSSRSTVVHEYIPAPGQFINEHKSGFTADITTPESAAAYAKGRMEARNYVSLGGFGGYITVGFDHSIENRGGHQGYDFAVEGNQLSEGSEAGIVWVMQDANGNGLPDDIWYELKGSESGKPETIQDYAVTYYRPNAPKSDVRWNDNRNTSGEVTYWEQFHEQDHYYPAWVSSDSYTLRGTRVSPIITLDKGIWSIQSLAWGYADNLDEDRRNDDQNPSDDPLFTYFKIDNAVYPDGSPAKLQYIDFVKIQTGVNAQCGWLGELSTEVVSVKDVNL